MFAASSSNSSSSSSSSPSPSSTYSPSPPCSSYDVFLSFRGEDTRNTFTAHLYDALCRRGINTFIDDHKLRRGEVISPTLIRAIENSMFSIIVLSENFASSGWCLNELVKVLECKKSRGQRVVPIFYNVDPSDIRKQRGSFGKALAKHEDISKERVDIWREALIEVANLSGWDSRNKHEPMLIKEIVADISNRLFGISLRDSENLIGIDSRLREMDSLLCAESPDIRMVGISGMGGIGKTTLAKAVYDEISCQFEGSAFLENVGEDLRKQGVIGLQEKLLSQLFEDKNLKLKRCTSIMKRLCFKKVLIVLDNVNDITILECLAGSQDWFGHGSRIIITTRDKRLLLSHKVKDYEVRKFNDNEAVEFLKHYSLKHQLVMDDFMELSKNLIAYAHGLPLALQVLGASLFSMSKHEWQSELEKLKAIPDSRIHKVLQISYDGLNDNEKNIFLDIACFFRGEDRDYAVKILDSCGFFPDSGIRTLVDKSLVSVSANKLHMHALLQEMGWEIVRQTSLREPGKRSRLWNHEDVCHVLERNTGTEEIEGIFLDVSNSEEIHVNSGAFERMNKLRLLKIYNSHLSRDSTCSSLGEYCKVHISRSFKFHFEDMRYLYWHGYPLKSLPSDFKPNNLLDLSLPYSHIKQLWKGVKVLKKLKFMDLSHAKNLRETPDFSGIINLELLVLEGCKHLVGVHPSLGVLKRLIFLSLRNCKKLKSLPDSICQLKSLETLILSGCSELKRFPHNFGDLEGLRKLYSGGTAIRELPPSFALLRNLEVSSFEGCKETPSVSWLLPRRSSKSFGLWLPPLLAVKSLRRLNLSDCNLSDGLNLWQLGFLSWLEDLNLSRNSFICLPLNMRELSQLTILRLNNCDRLQVLPKLSSSIQILSLHNCTSLGTMLHRDHRMRRPFLYGTSSFDDSFNERGISSFEGLSGVDVESMMQFVATNAKQPRRSRYFESEVPIVVSSLLHGSRLPDWFEHQSLGCEINIKLPSNWHDRSFLGFALCAVFDLKDAIHEEIFAINFDLASVHPNSESSHLYSFSDFMVYHADQDRLTESDHTWMAYVPFTSTWIHEHKLSNLKVSFDVEANVKRCGIRLISCQDVDDCQPTMIIDQAVRSNNSC